MTSDRIIELAHLGDDTTLLRELLAERLGVQHGDPDSMPLVDAAIECLRQVTVGKGRERHQRGRPFIEQPILVIPRLLGGDAGLGALLYQVMKKAEEAVALPEERQIAELRGVVIYALAAVMYATERSRR